MTAGSGSAPPPPPPGEESAQARVERDEFERGHVPEGTPPVTPRAAATVVVARPAPPSLEILLLERPRTSRFAAGAFVFPGGAVDADDEAEAWAGRLPEAGEPAACAAALRELFEETGILPGSGPSGPESLSYARRELLAERVRFSDLAARLGLDFSSAPIAYFARWITPRSLATRFDTRFFLLALEGEPAPVHLTSEHDSALWETPAVALERFAAGELPMMFPTRKTLERLAGFTSLAAALDALREVRVEPILAKLDLTGDQIRPLMPGDPGYDETY